MNALRWHGRGDIRLDKIPRPDHPGRGELLLRIEACGICGTDLEEWLHGPINIATTANPTTGRAAPLTLGHEFCGTVITAGDGTHLREGELVAVEVNLTCGNCWWCLKGDSQLCPSLASLGLHGDGGLAEFVVVPEAICVAVSASLSPLEAVFAEPLAVAMRAMRRADPCEQDIVLVLGGGALGQLTAQVAEAKGLTVLLVEPHAERRAVAERHSIESVSIDQAAARIQELSHRRGADVTFECSGHPSAPGTAVSLTRAGGKVMLLGVSLATMDLSPWDLIGKEQSIVGVLSHTLEDFTNAIGLLNSGAVTTDGYLTKVVPLHQVIDQALIPLAQDQSGHLKIVVTP